jgi:hypothetical protein
MEGHIIFQHFKMKSFTRFQKRWIALLAIFSCVSVSSLLAQSRFGADSFGNLTNFDLYNRNSSATDLTLVATGSKLHAISANTSADNSTIVEAIWDPQGASATGALLNRNQSWVAEVTTSNNVTLTGGYAEGGTQSVMWMAIGDGAYSQATGYPSVVRYFSIRLGNHGGVRFIHTEASNASLIEVAASNLSNVRLRISYNHLTQTITGAYSYDQGLNYIVAGSYSTAALFTSPDGYLSLALGAEIDHFATTHGDVYFTNFSVTNMADQIQAKIHSAVEISWLSVTGQLYQVQYTPSLAPATWTNFGTTVIGDGTEKSVYDQTRNQDKQFYRVLRLQ